MGLFGWDLPPGCSLNEIDRFFGADYPRRRKCKKCGCYLKETPNKTEEVKFTLYEGVEDYGTESTFVCTHCGGENKNFEY